ncbi:hypothetical protein GCM10028812_20840 [Ancylobacter sonchi]|uniref:hypothetical protein n=1 Tax=Ancylobacter sonchi TaxID=1937790 RepID=UPI001FEB49E7|nr:hypothetical protein [Ancylobacter sonchi]
MMRRLNLARLLAAVSLLFALAGSAHWLLPLGREAFALLMARDDAARLADLRLDKALTAERANREIDEALAHDDAELAASFLELADARALPVPAERRARVLAASSDAATALREAGAFGRGFVTGTAEDLPGLAGATAADLTVWGDIRDLGRQAGNYLRGDAVDPLMTGFAGVGLVATAATYAAFGAPLTLRAGLSLAKGARRAGALGLRLGDDLVGLLRSGRKARAIAAIGDIGRAGERAGMRATLAGLRHADDVTDVARLRRLSEAKGGQTLAVLKTLGRGALVLGEVAAKLAFWVVAAALNLLGLVASLNSTVVALLRPLWRGGRAGLLPA